MESGVSVSKQIHLDEQLAAFTWHTYDLFPMGFVRAPLRVSRCFMQRVVGGGRAGTPSSLYFLAHEEGPHEI